MRPLACIVLTLLLSANPLAGGETVSAPIDPKAVQKAIETGARFLLFRSASSGLFEGKYINQIGSTALAVCALRKAGVPADHVALKKAVRNIIAYSKTPLGSDQKLTYNAALSLLAFDACHLSVEDKEIRAASETLLAALLTNRGPRGGWHYYGKRDGDLSCSQYGALGLWAAERMGLSLPDGCWEQIAQYVISVHQYDGGGYAYNDAKKALSLARATKPSPSMTAAGIGTLALASMEVIKRRSNKDEKTSLDSAIAKSLELGFDGWKTLLYEHKDAYYWYAAERAFTLTGAKTMGDKPWFEALAGQILPLQQADGSWLLAQDDICDTSWALLALTHATEQMVETQSGWDGGKAKKVDDVEDAPVIRERRKIQ